MVGTEIFKRIWHGLKFQIHGKPRSSIPVIFCDNFAGSKNQIEQQAEAVINALGEGYEVIYFSNDPNTAELEIKHIFNSQQYNPQGLTGIAMGTRNYRRKAKAIIIGTGIGEQEQRELISNVVHGLPNGMVNVPWLVPVEQNGVIVGPVHGPQYALQLTLKVKNSLKFLYRVDWKHSGNRRYRY